MKRLGGKYEQIDSLIEGLRQTVAGLQDEVKLGRGNQSWLTNETNKTALQVQDKIREIQRGIELELIERRAEGNDLVKASDKYNARSYHAQMAQALAQGKDNDQLAAAFKGLDREQQQYKSEYQRIFSNKIDPKKDYTGWDQAVESMRTPEEQEQQTIFREVEEMRSFIPTLNAHIENSVVHAMSGEEKQSEHHLPVLDLFTDIRGTVEQRLKE